MSNWDCNIEKRKLIAELKEIEATFKKVKLDWAKIKRQNESALAVTVSIIKRQVKNNLIELK